MSNAYIIHGSNNIDNCNSLLVVIKVLARLRKFLHDVKDQPLVEL